MTKCKICKNGEGNKTHIACEMMYKTMDEFKYLECSRCGCLQINNLPEDLAKYYPADYYSYRIPGGFKNKTLKPFIEHHVSLYALHRKNLLGMLLSKKKQPSNYCQWFNEVKAEKDWSILDVGCGIGGKLMEMRRDGFEDLAGVDPYIIKDIYYDNGVRIFKKGIYDVNQQYDYIILSHSFEHMDKPLDVLRKAYSILKKDRYVLIRIPVSSSFSWKTYGVNWVQLDAPRHLFLHTHKSIQILAGQSGFKVKNVIFDSTEFQFWGSEQYLRNIAINDINSYARNRRKSIFSKKDIKAFRKKAIELNNNNEGDSACFYLYKD